MGDVIVYRGRSRPLLSSMIVKFLEIWKRHARHLRLEAYALYLACRDPRVPWYTRAFAACVVGYAFSPIDIIPDPIPVLGYLDDLALVPLGVLAARRMIPKPVLDECRERAKAVMQQDKPVNRVSAPIIVLLWILAIGAVIWFLARKLAA